MPAVHPIRWPGSWHRKSDPVLCSIDTAFPDNEIDLVKALGILKVAAPKSNGAPKSGLFGDFANANRQYQRPDDNVELMDKIRSGESYHDPLVCLAARFIGSGMSDRTVIGFLQDLMNASTGPRDDGRWHSRYSEIDRIVSTARAKYGRPEEAPPIAPDQEPSQVRKNTTKHGRNQTVMRGRKSPASTGALPASCRRARIPSRCRFLPTS